MNTKQKINNCPSSVIHRLVVTTVAIAAVIGALFIITLLTGGFSR